MYYMNQIFSRVIKLNVGMGEIWYMYSLSLRIRNLHNVDATLKLQLDVSLCYVNSYGFGTYLSF